MKKKLERFLIIESTLGAILIAFLFLVTMLTLTYWRITIFQVICWVCIKELTEWYYEKQEAKEEEEKRKALIQENWQKLENNK